MERAERRSRAALAAGLLSPLVRELEGQGPGSAPRNGGDGDAIEALGLRPAAYSEPHGANSQIA